MDPASVSGLTAVQLEGWQPSQVVEALWERYRIAGRAVAYPPAVRFSTTIFNTDDEVTRVVEAVSALVKDPASAPPVAGH
jgi:selenocysteine lyase/cysteine desulfurase